MTTMALTALFGLIIIIFLSCFFAGRASAKRAALRAEVEEEVTAKVRQAQEADAALVRTIVAGASVDQALTEYQRGRAAILPIDKVEKPWAWEPEDLEAWKKREIQSRIDDANRRLLLPAIGSCLLVVTLTIVTIGICYSFLPSHAADAHPAGRGTSPMSYPQPLPATDGSPAAPSPADAPTSGDAGNAPTSGQPATVDRQISKVSPSNDQTRHAFTAFPFLFDLQEDHV